MTKNELPTISIKGRDYVLVKDRITFFNDTYPNGSIRTEIHSYTNGQVIVKATVIPDIEKPDRIFTGYSQAKESDGMVNKTAALENAESSAVGRALAMMGIGVIDSIASADEMTKATSAPDNSAEAFERDFTAQQEKIERMQEFAKKGVLTDEERAFVDEQHLGGGNVSACPDCGEPMELRQGVSKAGKAWKGYFCTSGAKHTVTWL